MCRFYAYCLLVLTLTSCSSTSIQVGEQGIVDPIGRYKYCMVAVSPERFIEGKDYQDQDNIDALLSLESQGQVTTIPRGTEVTILETNVGLENRLAKIRVILPTLYVDEVYIEQSCLIPKK